jgi:hypothetical protein
MFLGVVEHFVVWITALTLGFGKGTPQLMPT